jgi:CBS domain-containing protein
MPCLSPFHHGLLDKHWQCLHLPAVGGKIGIGDRRFMRTRRQPVFALKGHVMATVQDILATKGSKVQSIGPEASVLDAALLMNEHKIGCLVVRDSNRVVGMFSERDILRRIVAERRDPATVTVADAMSTAVICCRPHTSLDEARGVMMNRRIRHLPVVDEDGHLGGLISIGDLNAYQLHDHQSTIYVMEQYIYGRA